MTTPSDPTSFSAPVSRQPGDPDRASRRRGVGAGAAVLWAVVAATIAAVGIVDIVSPSREVGRTEPLALTLIISCSIVGPIAALAAARLILRCRDRLAGLALVVSVITPTYFAAALNLPALICGVALLILPLANSKDARPQQGLTER